MEFMTIKEASERWNLSIRRIEILCTEGRIDGAQKFGTVWAIPKESEKPADARVKSGKYRDWRKRVQH